MRIIILVIHALFLFLSVSVAAVEEKQAEEDECTLYIAPSTLPDAGFGIFSAVERKPGDVLESSADICLPFVDMEWHHPGFVNPFCEYFWDGNAKGMSAESETGSVQAFCPGVHSLVNCQAELANVRTTGTVYDEMGLHRSQHNMAGANSPYGTEPMTVTRHIPAGGEVFTFYGSDWMGSSPKSENLDSLIKEITALLHEGNVFTGDVPRQLTEIRERHKETIEGATDTLRQCLKSPDPNEKHVRSLTWLKENGSCVDNIVKGPSTDNSVGAIARRYMRQGQVVTTSPLLHFVDGSIMNIYEMTREKIVSEDEDDNEDDEEPAWHHYTRHIDDVKSSQIALNYCFGHERTTLLLCPYGPGVNYIRGSTKPNVEIRWADGLGGNGQDLVNGLSLKNLGNLSPTLAFEYVALQDINAGEEILLDFGSNLYHELEKYTESTEDILEARSQSYTSAYEMNLKFGKAPVPTEEEEGRYIHLPEHIEVRCHVDVPYGKSPQKFEWDANDYGLPCVIVDRFIESDTELYTVDVEVWPEPDESTTLDNQETPERILRVIRTDLPRHALRFFDVPGTTDLHLTNSFRHWIGLPGDMLPEGWKNVDPPDDDD